MLTAFHRTPAARRSVCDCVSYGVQSSHVQCSIARRTIDDKKNAPCKLSTIVDKPVENPTDTLCITSDLYTSYCEQAKKCGYYSSFKQVTKVL